MPFRRRYARPRVARKNKYNINTTSFESIAVNEWIRKPDTTIYYNNKTIVPESGIGGTRKVKRFVINMALPPTSQMLFWWALVYVPEGTAPSLPSVTGEGYQPSQFVICQGMLASSSPVRINSPMSRNLNQNDKIMLVIWHDFGGVGSQEAVGLGAFIQYALCYN